MTVVNEKRFVPQYCDEDIVHCKMCEEQHSVSSGIPLYQGVMQYQARLGKINPFASILEWNVGHAFYCWGRQFAIP